MGRDARLLTGLAAAAVIAAAPSAARAEPPGELSAIVDRPVELGRGPTISERIADQLTLLGDAIDGHVGTLTLDAVQFRVDGRARRARLRMAGGEGRFLAFTLESDVHFRRGVAEVAATIDLQVAGRALHLELPDFELAPRSYLGERYVELRVPLVRGTF